MDDYLMDYRMEELERLHEERFPLHAAIRQGNNELARELISTGKKLNTISDYNNRKPLDEATLNGNLDIIPDLLEAGVNVESKSIHKIIISDNVDNETFLKLMKMLAPYCHDSVSFETIYYGYLNKRRVPVLLKTLIDVGLFDISTQDNKGNTLLHHLLMRPHSDIRSLVEDVLKNGASTIVRNKEGNKPIHIVRQFRFGIADSQYQTIQALLLKSEEEEMLLDVKTPGDD
jgi:ankyrin repeat protein